jgi:hypothetical protein
MSNALYAKGAEKILSAAINFGTDSVKAILVSSAYTADLANDEFLSTIDANRLGTDQTLGSKSVSGGKFNAANITFPAVAAGSTAKAVVLYKDTGDRTTSPLLAYIDTITGFPLATNGGDVTVAWDSGTYKIVSLV